MRYDFPILITAVVLKIKRLIARQLYGFRTRVLCYMWGVKAGTKVRFIGRTLIRNRRKGAISLGNSVVLNSNTELNPVGLINPNILDTLLGGNIAIDDFTGASAVVISSAVSVKIGKNCMIGGNVRIFDHDFHPLEYMARRPPQDVTKIRKKEVEIGDDCFIGTNVTILKGTKIGSRSIVAAGSVVFGLIVPPNSLVRGNPAIVEKTI